MSRISDLSPFSVLLTKTVLRLKMSVSARAAVKRHAMLGLLEREQTRIMIRNTKYCRFPDRRKRRVRS